MSGEMTIRSPKEVIELYWEEVWNKGNAELIREICADPIIRHDIGSVTALSHDEQVRRVSQQIRAISPHFTHEVLIADDLHVTSVWNMTSASDPSLELCGIETFRAENGRFTHCWNAPYAKGRWGREGDASVASDLAPPEFVSTVEAMDHTWLQKVFAAADVEVPRVAMVHTFAPVGNGTTSRVYRLQFGYNADAEKYPTSLIAKLPGSRLEAAGDLVHFFGYDREVAAYKYFGTQAPFRIPRVYYAEWRGAGNFCLVLEDIGKSGRSGDQLTGGSVEDARAVIREFAAMHAHSLGDTELGALEWPLRHAERASAMAQVYGAGQERFHRRYGDRLSGAVLAVIDAVAPLVEAWSAAPPAYQALIHGEPRIDNIFFEDAGASVRACLIDLQQVTLGDPIFDVAYFLSGSIDPKDRAAHERALVAEHGTALQSSHAGYDAAGAWERYREYVVAGLIATVGAAGLAEPPEELDDLLLTLARRNCAAIIDLDGVAAAKRRADSLR